MSADLLQVKIKMKLAFLAVIAVLGIQYSVSIKVPAEWEKYLEEVIKNFLK